MSYAAATAAQRAAAVRACERFIQSAKNATQDYRTAAITYPQVENGTYQTVEQLLTSLKTAVDAVNSAA